MKTVFKRLISSLLLVVMLVAAIPASLVSAAGGEDIDWDYLKDKYGLTDSQIDSVKDLADELGITKEQIDAVEDYYDSLPPEEQEELKETAKESIDKGEIPELGGAGGEVAKDFAKAMLLATIKKAAKEVLNRVLGVMEDINVENPFDINRVYEDGKLVGVDFVLEAPEETNLLDAVKDIVNKYEVLDALKLMAGAVLMYDEVSINGYTVYDLADPSAIRNALVAIYKANPIEFSTIANMEGNVVATYNFSLSCMGTEIELPVSFVINCSEETLTKIRNTAKKLADMVEVNGDFTAEDGVFSADLEGVLDVSDYVDNVLAILLPAAIADDYALVREKLHAMTLGDAIDQVKLENLQVVAKKLGYEKQFGDLVEKIADRFNLSLEEPNDLKALVSLIDDKGLLSVYVKSAMQKAKAATFKLAKVGAEELKSIIDSLGANAAIPAAVIAAMAKEYGVDFDLNTIKPAKLKELLLSLEEKAQIPESFKEDLKKAYGVLNIEKKLNTTVGSFYNGDGSYSFTIGNGFGPIGFQAYADKVLNKLLSSKWEERVSKALNALGYSSVETYVNTVKTKYNAIYTGKYDLDMSFTLVLFDVYTVTFLDENGVAIDTQKVVAGDSAKDPYYHGGSVLNTNYTADQVYENVQSDMTVALTPINHKEVITVIVAGDCTTDREEHVTCAYGCNFEEDRVITAPGHNFVTEEIDAECYVDGCTRHTCTVCGYQYDDNFVSAHHTWSDWMPVEDATCTENGKQVRRCYVCLLTEWAVIPATGHTLVQYDIPATCEHEGYRLWYCSVCHEAGIYKVLDKLDHNFVEIGRDEYCTEEGTVYYECSYGCGTKKQEAIPAVGHDYVATDVPATCTDEGYTLHTCSRCGDTYMDAFVPALGHDYVIISETPATHTEPGEIIYECTRCGHVYTEVVAPIGHNWTSVWYEPTCTDAGYFIHTCVDCGISYMETVGEPLYHDYTYTIVDPTCTESGKIIYVCDRCGHTEIEYFGTPIGHTYNSVVTKQPTCQEEGEILYTCAICGHTYTEAIPTVDHLMIIYSNPDPKCDEDVVIVLACKYGCGYHVEITIPATGHNWVDVERVEPTCGEDGYDTDYCTKCGLYRTRILPATGAHDYEKFIVHDATCANAGMVTYFCMNCGDHYEEYTDINPDAHSFNTVVKAEADCVNGGILVHTCIFCGKVVEEQVPALGHAWDFNGGTYVAPSCGVDGSWTFTCARGCGETLVITVPALGVHAWGNAVVLKPATCVDDGEVQYTCLVCGEIKVDVVKATGEHIWKDEHVDAVNCHTPAVDYKVCVVCGEKSGETETPLYHPPVKNVAVNMAFINNILVVKIDKMTVGEFKSNFYESITVYDKNGNLLDDSKYVGTGATFVCDVCGTVFHVAVIADINGDGKVNSIDYMYVKRHALGTYKLSGVMLAAADVNVDCNVSGVDYMMTRKHVMYRYHIYERFPAWESIDQFITSMPNPFAN